MAAVVACGLLVAAAEALTSTTFVSSGAGPTFNGSVTRIVGPYDDQLVRGGRVQVVIRSGKPLHSLRVLLNGHSIRGRLHAAGAGVYKATLRRGGVLRGGHNLLTVRSHAGAQFDFDYVGFVVARRARGLLRVRRLQVGGGGEPVRVVVRLARNAILRAWVNGRRVDRAFLAERGQLVGRLGANDGLRQGPNRIVLLAYKSSGSGASHSVFSRRFRLPRSNPIAAAGADRIATRNEFVRFDGTGPRLGRGVTGHSLSWAIAQAPRGSRAKLIDANTEHPGLMPDVPGTYRIRLVLAVGRRGRPPRLEPGAASGQSATASSDTATLLAQPDDPYGVALQSLGPDNTIVLNGEALAGTGHYGGTSYALLNRTTLNPEAKGQAQPDRISEIAKANSDGNHLLIVNFPRGNGYSRDTINALVKLVGGQDFPSEDHFAQHQPGSVIGIPGAPAGTAFQDHRDILDKPDPGNLSGYLRRNGVTGLFDFVFTDYVHVDTAVGQTATESTIVVGDKKYTSTHPAGVSGFEYLRLDSKTLAPQANFLYVTNSANAAADAKEVTRLANDLTFATTEADHPLVILQSYGAPAAYSADWDRAATAIQKLGGTRQVFNALNQSNSGLNPDDGGRRGAYAFIGRGGGGAPRAEASYPLTGRPGRLAGLLMRSRSADFEPMMVSNARVDGSSPVNEELVRIVNQPATPYPPLASKAAETFLGGPEVMGVCQAGAPCDVRQTYHTNYRGTWATIATSLLNAKTKCQDKRPGFTPDECEKVRSQLFDEVQAGNRVRHYLGPEGLQQPFGAAGVAALANIGAISNDIQTAVNPPPADNTTSHALNITSYILKIGSFAPPPASQVAAGLGAVFGLAGYLTKKDNAANLIGPQVQTAASKLGVELTRRYQTAGDQFDDTGRIIVGDYGKLNQVAGKVDSDPNWILGNVGAARDALELGAKQTVYERLLPLAWPVLYDLGGTGNARNWYCDGGLLTFDKHLFADEPDSDQSVHRFERTGWNPVIAVAAANATGSKHDARIPGPPGSLTEPLFRAPTDPRGGGIGLNKLEFYSPRLGFRYFPPEPARDAGHRDSHKNWNTLYPGNGHNPIRCADVPEPPGNSG
jgi:hypothetical protein